MQNRTEYLIDQLDQQLLEGNSASFAAELANDEGMAAEWLELQVAVAAAHEAGLYNQVGAVAADYKAKTIEHKPAVVRSMFKNVMRVAAVVILLAGAISIYKYASVDSVAVYEHYYTSFDLNTTRGASNADQMEKAYRAKDWKQVINTFNELTAKNNRAYFLAGMAHLELKDPSAATPLFNEIIKSNTQTGENYFEDEAEYYLAMSHLAARQPAQALPLLEKIRGNKDHLYNRVVSNMSWIELRIAASKAGK